MLSCDFGNKPSLAWSPARGRQAGLLAHREAAQRRLGTAERWPLVPALSLNGMGLRPPFFIS